MQYTPKTEDINERTVVLHWMIRSTMYAVRNSIERFEYRKMCVVRQ